MRILCHLTLLLFISMGLNSCSSTQINQLEGQWQICWINGLTDENLYIWNFEGGELTVLQYDPNSPLPQPTIGGRAQYTTSAGFLDAVVEITGFIQSNSTAPVIAQVSNGKWTIDIINREVLRLSTTDQLGSSGSYVIREFARPDSDKVCQP